MFGESVVMFSWTVVCEDAAPMARSSESGTYGATFVQRLYQRPNDRFHSIRHL